MLKNYLKVLLRNILSRKTFSIINLAGLAVGMACTLLIALWIKYELEYDHFHENINEICRVVTEYDGFRTPSTPGPMAEFLQNEIPEILVATRFKNDRTVLRYGDNSVRLVGLNAEPSFMDIFTFPQITGDVKAALDDVECLVLTQSAAKKLFGEEDPIGKIVKISNRWTGKISAIIADVPQNSSPPLRFEYLSPFKIYYFWRDPDNWDANSDYNTWVKLAKNTSLDNVNEKIDALVKRHNPDPKLRIFLQPMKQIHLQADCHRWDGPHGDLQYVIIFSLLAVVILVIACINFMNLATARSMVRAKEVGIRKVVGANRKQLIVQFFSESFFLAFLALPLAWILIELSLPKFNELAGYIISFNYKEIWVIIASLVIILITGFFSGFYPAIFLSSFKPVKILKNVFPFDPGALRKGKGFSLRRSLVVGQFSLSIIVIIGTLIIYQQLSFIRNENLGFDQENMIYITLGNNYGPEAYRSLKNELSTIPSILSVAGSDQIPIDTDYIPSIKWKVNGEQKLSGFPTFIVDESFLDNYKIQLLKGRFFSEKFSSDSEHSFVINQAAVQALGYKDPLGQEVEISDKKGRIIGIVQDFHFETFREQIEPLFLMYSKTCFFLNIRIMPVNISETIKQIEEITKKYYPGLPFMYHFLDRTIDEMYWTDQRMGKIFTYFSVLAIFISCLGLFGLISFIVERKTKEIGIRKVLGASVGDLIQLLSREFVKWILLANLIAWPIAWYAMDKWLQDFAYKVNIAWWVFLLAGGIALVIALITVSAQAIKAAIANPVEALRYE